MFTQRPIGDVYSFFIYNCPKPKITQMSQDERVNKWWYIHTIESYLAMKWNELLIKATTWTSLESIMVSARASHKSQAVWFHLSWTSWKRGKNQISGCQGPCGEQIDCKKTQGNPMGRWTYSVPWYGDGYTQYTFVWIHLSVYLERVIFILYRLYLNLEKRPSVALLLGWPPAPYSGSGKATCSSTGWFMEMEGVTPDECHCVWTKVMICHSPYIAFLWANDSRVDVAGASLCLLSWALPFPLGPSSASI